MENILCQLHQKFYTKYLKITLIIAPRLFTKYLKSRPTKSVYRYLFSASQKRLLKLRLILLKGQVTFDFVLYLNAVENLLLLELQLTLKL